MNMMRHESIERDQYIFFLVAATVNNGYACFISQLDRLRPQQLRRVFGPLPTHLRACLYNDDSTPLDDQIKRVVTSCECMHCQQVVAYAAREPNGRWMSLLHDFMMVLIDKED